MADGSARVPVLFGQLGRGLRRRWVPEGVNQPPPGGPVRRARTGAQALRLDHAGQQLRQLRDVNLRHLEGVVLGQLLLVFQGRDDAAQLVESFVQPVHPPPLPGVGRDAPVPLGAEVARPPRLRRPLAVRGGRAIGRFARRRDARVRVPPGEGAQRSGGHPALGVDVGQVALLQQG